MEGPSGQTLHGGLHSPGARRGPTRLMQAAPELRVLQLQIENNDKLSIAGMTISKMAAERRRRSSSRRATTAAAATAAVGAVVALAAEGAGASSTTTNTNCMLGYDLMALRPGQGG